MQTSERNNSSIVEIGNNRNSNNNNDSINHDSDINRHRGKVNDSISGDNCCKSLDGEFRLLTRCTVND